PQAVLTLTWCGGGCFDSRRRVNSTVRPLREANPVSDSNVVILSQKQEWAVLIEERVFELSELSSARYPELEKTCEKNMDLINADSNLRYNCFDCTRSANDRLSAAAILRHPYQHRSSRPTHSGKRREREVVSGL